jgi:hypothetical protein
VTTILEVNIVTPTQGTIKRLFAVSGNKCAFPKCTERIFDGNYTHIGRICHIEADSPGGSRYNSTQSEAERQAFENLVLMCANHHIVIDDNPESYTVDVLKEIKARHEQRYLGGEEPSDDIVNRLLQIIDGTDLRILRALPMSGPSFNPVYSVLGRLGIEEIELGDRLESLTRRGLIQVAGLGGSYAPGMTLSNGIHNVGLTGEGRQFLRDQR